ncbi:uncharacterized protein LOC123223161 [Mangifera indica]|uniref:uncharacterized protein LOC123223161 n=1 Tax=Mangifera indica TaxID=29780 RepID=UPI001CFB36A4|nr:uncharacterized protein LOC123223161 [Mangifera indica]
MSVLQYPDTLDGQELHIWNNAAFDNGESEDSKAIKGSWSNLQSVYVNQSLESDFSKENLSPGLAKSPVSSSLKSFGLFKPLQMNTSIKNSQTKPVKTVSKMMGSKNGVEEQEEEEEKRDEKKIDMEIEEIEKEISRLSSRLHVLRLEKIELKSKAIEKRGRIVPAKFMEKQQGFKNLETMKKSDEDLLSSAKSKFNRRGVSLGPAEIFSAAKSRQSLGKPNIITPVQSTQSRRKSCFWKLQEIDELRVTKERGKSSSLSPKSRKTAAAKILPPKQAMSTLGSKKNVKRDSGMLSLIQPKELFRDGEKSAASKKPMKPGRIVASRYNQITNDSRKRSLENDKEEESNGCDKRYLSRREKKKWEIPSEVVVYKGSSPPSISKIGDELPKIKTIQCVDQSSRDSGAAKRVAELAGRKSYFFAANEEETEEEGSVCQTLSFDENGFEEF